MGIDDLCDVRDDVPSGKTTETAPSLPNRRRFLFCVLYDKTDRISGSCELLKNFYLAPSANHFSSPAPPFHALRERLPHRSQLPRHHLCAVMVVVWLWLLLLWWLLLKSLSNSDVLQVEVEVQAFAVVVGVCYFGWRLSYSWC